MLVCLFRSLRRKEYKTTLGKQLVMFSCSPLYVILVLLQYVRWKVGWRFGLFGGVAAPESSQWIHWLIKLDLDIILLC